MKAEIIAIGSELTCGARLDTNSQWLSLELEARGWTVQRHTTVADDRAGMIRCYQEAAQRCQLVLITGGLGPTLDDITRDTLAEAFDQPLVEDAVALKHIEALFQSRNREMPERNKVQALRPANSVSVHNAHGTAPGILMKLADPDCTIAVMPGVPAEMKLMFHEQIVAQLPQSGVFVARTVIRTFGFGESDAERLLGELTARDRNPEVGITASNAVISLSVTARAATAEECEILSATVCEQIRERLGDAVFGTGDDDLHHVVADRLLQRDLRIAVLEGSTTGGLIGHWLTETESYATRLTHCQLFPTVAAIPSDDSWESELRQQGESLIRSGKADYVVLSSPGFLVREDNGVRRQQGSVTVFGRGLDSSHDVSMTGNLAIFRERAARIALNQLRLHLR
jgi:nicotinamide-nucleotide amidase